MSADIYTAKVTNPSVGDVLEIPTGDTTVDAKRVGAPQGPGRQSLVLTVAGVGSREDHVLVTEDGGEISVPDGSVVFGPDPADGDVWVAIPASQYGGGSDD